MLPSIDPSVKEALTLHLLDPNQGVPIQTWTFTQRNEVRIGRASESDVVILHPCVSRSHVQIYWCDGHWELVNVSTLGTLLKGERATTARLSEGDEFRLGPHGPTLRFHRAPLAGGAGGGD